VNIYSPRETARGYCIKQEARAVPLETGRRESYKATKGKPGRLM